MMLILNSCSKQKPIDLTNFVSREQAAETEKKYKGFLTEERETNKRNLEELQKTFETQIKKEREKQEAKINKTIGDAEAKINKTIGDAEANINKTIGDAEANINKTIGDAEANIKKEREEQEANINKTIEDAEANINKTIEDAEANINKTIEDAEANINKTKDQVLQYHNQYLSGNGNLTNLSKETCDAVYSYWNGGYMSIKIGRAVHLVPTTEFSFKVFLGEITKWRSSPTFNPSITSSYSVTTSQLASLGKYLHEINYTPQTPEETKNHINKVFGSISSLANAIGDLNYYMTTASDAFGTNSLIYPKDAPFDLSGRSYSPSINGTVILERDWNAGIKGLKDKCDGEFHYEKAQRKRDFTYYTSIGQAVATVTAAIAYFLGSWKLFGISVSINGLTQVFSLGRQLIDDYPETRWPKAKWSKNVWPWRKWGNSVIGGVKYVWHATVG